MSSKTVDLRWNSKFCSRYSMAADRYRQTRNIVSDKANRPLLMEDRLHQTGMLNSSRTWLISDGLVQCKPKVIKAEWNLEVFSTSRKSLVSSESGLYLPEMFITSRCLIKCSLHIHSVHIFLHEDAEISLITIPTLDAAVAIRRIFFNGIILLLLCY